MKISTYKGVTRAVRCDSRPWRAQCAVAGKTYHLGNFETEEEAAKAYDNILHYAGEYGFTQRTECNFPRDYAEQTLPMTSTTRRIILDCCGRVGAKDPKKLNRLAARFVPLLREMSVLLPELEDALSSRPTNTQKASAEISPHLNDEVASV